MQPSLVLSAADLIGPSMMEMIDSSQESFVFISGKNWKLSLAEVVSILEARNCGSRLSHLSKSFFVLSGEGVEPSLVDDLGGIIKIGKVRMHFPSAILEDAFLRGNRQAKNQIRSFFSGQRLIEDAPESVQKKLIFGVSLYFDNLHYLHSSREIQRFIASCVKNELTTQGLKSRYMGFPRRRKLPQLTHVEVLKKKLVEKNGEILVCIGDEGTYVSNTIGVHNPFDFQERDIGRPAQRRIFSIPPRLARIMVNLAQCLPGRVFLDPFCGVGTILQEAMLTKANVIGVDKNPWCIEASSANIEWLRKKYALKESKATLLLGNARNLTNQIERETIDCIATEPDLGPALRHIPTDNYGRRIIGKLKPVYTDFLEEAYKVLRNKGRLALVTPCIRTRNETNLTLTLKDDATRIGFSIVSPLDIGSRENSSLLESTRTEASFVDMSRKHKVGREIHVFQK